MSDDIAYFPLSAVVGAERLKLALCLNAIDPRIGGVLIEGPRGMAKTTLARGVADLLPNGVFATLPLGASEERIVGTLDLETVLAEGRSVFSPGILAKADGGVLYVDEVNLLADHLVDLLLDTAASGVNVVERDGISHRHAARFILIGTMNPEEGELRPQLLDRFGLNVVLSGQPEPGERAQIVRRRLAFDDDPQAFRATFATEQAALRERCQRARELLAAIALDEHALAIITERCFAAGVDGVRADLVWLRAARAHAAWRGTSNIGAEDIDAVEEFVLQHRRNRDGNQANLPTPDPADGDRDAAQPTSSNLSSANTDPATGQGTWGAMPAQALPIGTAHKIPSWPKKL